MSIVIDFLCNRNAGHFEQTGPKNISWSEEERLWLFEYKTALACQPMAGLCTTYDSGTGFHFDISDFSGVTLQAEEEITFNGNQFALTVCGEPPNHHQKPLEDYPNCQDESIAGAQDG